MGFLLSVGFIARDLAVTFERRLILLVQGLVDLLLGETHSRLYLVYRAIVPRKGTRLREAAVTQVTDEGAHVVVAPVVHDQARALREPLLAPSEVADEICLHLTLGFVVDLDPVVGAFGHSFEACIRLRSSNILSY